MEEQLLEAGIPDEWMRLVPAENGSYDLVIRHSPELILRIATVHQLPELDPKKTIAMARALAASFALLHRLDEVLEELQPDGWDDIEDDEESGFWRRMFRTWLQALGQPIPAMLQDPTPPPAD